MKFSLNRVKQGLGEVQNLKNWAFSIPNPAAVAGEFPEDLEVRVQSVGIPTAEFENLQVSLGGHPINYNGKVTKAGSITLTAVEGTDARFSSYMYNWISNRWTGDGKDTQGSSAPTADCKADVQIALLGPDDAVTQTFTLVGCLASFDGSADAGQDSGEYAPTVTLDYDDFHVDTGSVKW